MTPKSLCFLAASVVVLHFTIILYMLSPLLGTKNAYKSGYSSHLSLRHPSVNWCKELHWKTPPSPNVVALVSHPGSGNTWLRYLLQQATGIYTGSVYLDQGLRVNGFPAENVTDGSVLVVKTHFLSPWPKHHNYTSAVLLIRNPRDAILAEFNRLHRGHIGSAPTSAFQRITKDDNQTFWASYVPMQLQNWEALYRMWLTKFTGPIHIVVYEVLVKDTRKKLGEVLQFLNHTVSDADMDCVMKNKEGIYRRRKSRQTFDPFTPDMYKKLDEYRNRMMLFIAEYMQAADNTDNNFYAK